MQNVRQLYRWLTAQHCLLWFGGPDPGKPAAPRASTPAPAAIAPPKESSGPIGTFNPETERQGTVQRPAFVIGSGQKKKYGQTTVLGAGV